jgi:hypothetical protein
MHSVPVARLSQAGRVTTKEPKPERQPEEFPPIRFETEE